MLYFKKLWLACTPARLMSAYYLIYVHKWKKLLFSYRRGTSVPEVVCSTDLPEPNVQPSARFVSFGFGSFRFDSIRFDSIRFVSFRFVSFRFWFEFVSFRFGSFRFVDRVPSWRQAPRTLRNTDVYRQGFAFESWHGKCWDASFFR